MLLYKYFLGQFMINWVHYLVTTPHCWLISSQWTVPEVWPTRSLRSWSSCGWRSISSMELATRDTSSPTRACVSQQPAVTRRSTRTVWSSVRNTISKVSRPSSPPPWFLQSLLTYWDGRWTWLWAALMTRSTVEPGALRTMWSSLFSAPLVSASSSPRL